MEHIDFFKERQALHKKMYKAIVELMKANKVDELDLREYDEYDRGYAINCSGAFACEEQVLKIRLKNGCIEVVTLTDGEESPWLDLDDDFLMASFETLYDAMYYILNDKNNMEPKLAFVLRSCGEDCTGGGATSKHETVYLFPIGTSMSLVKRWIKKSVNTRFNSELPESLDDVDNVNVEKYIEELKERCLVLDKQNGHISAQVVFKKDGGMYCFGGNYINGDSNFSQMVGHSHPVPVHDRFETWNAYHVLSQ